MGVAGRGPADRLTSPDSAISTAYFTTYRIDGFHGGQVAAGPPVQVGHYEDTFRRVDGNWLIGTRTLFLPFGGATPRH